MNAFNQTSGKSQGSKRVQAGHGGSDDSPNKKERKKIKEERERAQVKTVAGMISIFMKTLGWGDRVSLSLSGPLSLSLSLSLSPSLSLSLSLFSASVVLAAEGQLRLHHKGRDPLQSPL